MKFKVKDNTGKAYVGEVAVVDGELGCILTPQPAGKVCFVGEVAQYVGKKDGRELFEGDTFAEGDIEYTAKLRGVLENVQTIKVTQDFDGE